MRKLGWIGVSSFLACATLLSGERDALACGGCFHEAPTPQKPIVESSVVSDHRMVLAIAPQQTILWDQIRYTGDPSEFAWVLPVRPGTTIEISHDEWIAALDATTQPTIVQPQAVSQGGFGGGFGGGGGDGNSGCGCTPFGSSSDSSLASSGAQNVDGGATPKSAPPPVQVVSQEVVGPYETVIVRSDKPKALESWLQDHGYAVPDSMLPIITAYTQQKLDFVALRLRPGQGVRAMRPVRIVSPGADPTLPLRMVAAGIGAHVGITLFVLSEGRYRPQNFPETQIDEKKIVWDPAQSRSNYQELAIAAMAGGDQRTWLTESAAQPAAGGPLGSASNASSLYTAYYSTCAGRTRAVPPTPETDAGPDAGPLPDAGEADAGEGDAGEVDAGEADAATPPPDDTGTLHIPDEVCSNPRDLCCEYDDLEKVLNSMHRSDVWLTRLRADLPASALDVDLKLEAHPSQTTVSNQHNALLPTGTTARIAPSRNTHLGTGLALFGAALWVARKLRKRAR